MNNENGNCTIRDLGLCAVLQLSGYLPVQTSIEKKDDHDYVLFTFALNPETKKIMGDYRMRKLSCEPNQLITIYKSIKRSVSKIRWGENSQTHEGVKNGKTS